MDDLSIHFQYFFRQGWTDVNCQSKVTPEIIFIFDRVLVSYEEQEF